jgi:hypothetical protein
MAGAPDALPTPEALQAGTARLKADPQIQVRAVGRSAKGRPIELISLGEGARNALVVGCPHPNEPVGCLTIEALIERLRREPGAGAGFRWHFIKAIDPDGLDLNRSWLKGPRTIERYYRGFYRPAFDRQPEYTFPLKAGAYEFNRSTPENDAWRAALELTRPQMQASLHNADYGGAFYILSHEMPGLAAALARQPGEVGLTLNPIGEPFADMAPYAAGVLAFPDIAAAAKAGAWAAGNSSAGYAAARYGTFSLVNEVPFWDDERLRDGRPSGRILADVARLVTAWNAQLIPVLSHNLTRLSVRGADAESFKAALDEALAGAGRQNAMLARLAGSPAMATPLAVKDWALQATILRLAALRPYAMLGRLASMSGAAAIRSLAASHLRQGLSALHAEARLSIVPIPTLVELQTRAVLTTAQALG